MPCRRWAGSLRLMSPWATLWSMMWRNRFEKASASLEGDEDAIGSIGSAISCPCRRLSVPFLAPQEGQHLQGLFGRSLPGKSTSQISNHFSTRCVSWFFFRFCLSRAAHWASSMPSFLDGSPSLQDTSIFRWSAKRDRQAARSVPGKISWHRSHWTGECTRLRCSL
jgi:hypothetical protein